MAIFNNSDSRSNAGANSNTTIITAGAKIRGEIELTCNLYIDGELDGIIKSSKEVNVGKNGHVKGEVFTDRLVVQGLIEGTVNSNVVEIKAAGHIRGEITANELIIESKGIFEGNSIVKDSLNDMSKPAIGKTEA